MRSTLKIGELARQSEVTTKTVRYYELRGLLHEPERTDSGYRLYDERDVERLVFIRKAKELGFSLADISEILVITDAEGLPCIHVLALLDRKIEEITLLVEQLNDFQQELGRLREESAAQGEAEEGAVCAIIDRGLHAKGEAAVAWLKEHGTRQLARDN